MPQKETARLRELIDELDRAQVESGDLAGMARQELARLMQDGALKPERGTSAARRSKKKAGRKKR